ncbi:hypothetical protein [Streptomyces violascens]|uniref:hypothetical protein n=1 Tax=Streptomyces violascens TaxID=67381 RepID=UPI001677711A|nr:hypothetical protein [Streptomyces violascens]GGU10359.1 hypothetical protein GCM10010289_34370 [Streptomyces violascens]
MNAQLTRYDRWMQQTMNRRAAAPLYATAGRRRVLVVGHIALTAAYVAAFLAALLDASIVAACLLVALLLPWCLATGAINSSTRGLLELRRRALDERQRAERSEVLARAHRITTGLLFATVAAVGGYRLAGGNLEAVALPALLGILVVHWLMPMWVAGLRAQDEPDDE